MSEMSSESSKKSPAVRTYRGSCHCGAVRFEVDFDPSTGSGRCNCSICSKSAYWGKNVKPDAFRLLAGEGSLADYSRSDYSHHRFCKVCGIKPFGHGNIPEIGGEYYSVNLNCLDDAELSGMQITYLDGRHNTWAQLNAAPYADPFKTSSGRA